MKKPAKKKLAKKPLKKLNVKKAVKKSTLKKNKAQKKIVTTTTTTTVTTVTTKVNPKETHYLLILDESGSMGSVKKETLSGLNEQIQTIKNLDAKYPDQDYFVSIIKFDNEIIPLFEDVPASKLRELTNEDYKPDSLTALHDAIGISVNKLKDRISSRLKDGEASALVVILTDGDENASKEYNSSKIKDLITGLEKTGMWTFTFIGANQDSILTAKNLGVNINNTVNYTASGAGTGLAFASVSSAMSMRSAYVDAGAYAATQDTFLSRVTKGNSNIGEDASVLNLTGTVSGEDIQKAKDDLNNAQNTQNTLSSK